MIICKNRAIFLFLLLIIYLDDAGANRKKTNRKAKCAKPKPVKNAVLRDRYANKKKFKEGDKVEYDCELGYTLEGKTRKRRCRNTKWTDVRFTCTPTCAKPKEVQNAVLRDEYANKAKFKEGDKVEYDCELGYTIEGITSERWCNNSKWTDVRFTCNLKCAKPKPVQNAVLRDEYADIETFKEGDKVEYDCELGYTIEGLTRERWCRNTRWTEVRFTCNQITCSWVPHPDNGRHLDTSYAVGDVMKFECNIGYKLKGRDAILCRIDGQWSPPQGPTCDPILCPTLPQIQHGSIFQDTSDGLANNYESVAEYTCDRDYYLNGNTQLKTVRRTCQSDGKWSGNEPICEVPKCNLLDDFYGGSVEYFGRRDLYSQAFYSCDENYSMIPSNVQHSTCENNLRWEPPPPKCFKKADRYVPKDGYFRGWKRGKVSHGESYKICCDKGFEIERDDSVPVNKEECTNIRNNNGTLDPKVECVEEWCETDRRHTEYKHENGSEFTSRIPSNEDVWISCEKWYAFYDSRNELLLSPQKRRCVQGQIKDAPTCIEAKSSLAGYPYNEFTFYKDRKRNRLDRETYIEPNERIEVYCSDGYELYVEFNQEYLDQFTTTSRHGSFDKEKNDFPVCREKRCNPNSLKHAGAKYENKTQVDFSTKIQGGTYIFVFCQDGFAFYDDNGQAIETMQKRQCMKGTIVDAPKCQEAKCSLAEYPSNQYTSYYNLNLKAIIEPKTDYIESSHKIQVNCTNSKEYELYVNASNKYVDTFKTKCNQGIFNRRKKMFPVCVEKRCSFEPSNAQGACFLTDDGGSCKREQFNIQSGSSIHIKCKQGYTLFVSKKEVKGQKIITCNKGSHPDFSCTANDCSAPGVNNTEPLSTSVYKHNEEVTYKCNKGYWFSKSKLGEKKIIFFKSTCSLGNWTNHIPRTCEPVACFLNVQAGTEYSIYGTGKDILNSSFVENGTSIGVRCKDGFDLYDDADTLINDTNVVPEVTCHVGEWSNKHWCKERCYIPNRANIQFSKDGENLTINDTIKHMESVNITCAGEQGIFSSFIKCENGTFDQYDKCTSGNDFKSSISTSTMSTASTKNENNQQQNVNEAADDTLAEMEDHSYQIEEHSNKSKGCKLSEDERYMYLNMNEDEIKPGDYIVLGDTLTVKCRFNDVYPGYDYEYYDTVSDTTADDITISCQEDHILTKMHKECPKGSCRVPEMENMAKLSTPKTHYAIGETVRDFTCSRGHFLSSDKGMTCQNNGTWSDVITCVKGCKLPEDERYTFLDINGDEIKPGDNIVVGDALTVKCRFIDIYSYIGYDYDYFDTDTDTTADDITISDDITIVCKDDHTMTKITKECPQEPKDKRCLEIDNGNVQKSNGYYVVSCDKGFSLDIFEPNEKRSNCLNGKLKSVIGSQEPKCVPDRCQVPYDYDTLLSISDRSRVSLSGGSVVEVGDYVYFNCSKAGDDMHEPVNRRFKCINGQWIEDERDKSWKFGNNGSFPKCRKTNCEPVCQNGGVCLRDDQCACKHFTSGKRCENVICDDECYANQGECVGPRKCKCPEGKTGTHCEQSFCRLPENKDMANLTTQRTYFGIGETVRTFMCDPGHFLSSDQGMTCQSDGSWSDIITCVKGKWYLISTKTGERRFAGTDANVFITLFGSKGSTRKITFEGSFESGKVDEIRRFARDIGPIQSVQIGHDGGIFSGWDLEYISIYVEKIEEFYVFRNIKQQWVKEGSDLTLEREGSRSCINTFSDKHRWYPNDWKGVKGFHIGKGSGMSRRACKQACINLKKVECNGVYRDTRRDICYGFTKTHVRYFSEKNEAFKGELFFRKCKH